MNSTLSFSPDSSGSDSIDWLAHTEGPYPDSGVHTDVEYPGSCVLGSELSGLLETDKQLENHCSLSYSMAPYSQSADFDPMASYSQTPVSAPCQFDAEQYRLVHMRREYQKMLLDVEKKIIENKISWIDQANTDQMMICQDPFSVMPGQLPPAPPAPVSAPNEIFPEKLNHTFPTFAPQVPPPDPLSPIDFPPQELPVPGQMTASNTHKIPHRRSSNSRVQPYYSHALHTGSEKREGAGEGVKKRQSHNAIEERYRKRINSRIQELKSIVAPDEPLPKSNILAKALVYIRELEEKNRNLEDRIAELSGFGPSPSSNESSSPLITSSPPAHQKAVLPKLSPPTPKPHNQPRDKPRSNSAKILFCLFTIVLCLCAPDPASIRDLPSAFASRDNFGGLGSAVFRSRTLLYLSESSVGTSIRQSSSLIHPFSLLSWSVRLSLVSLSLAVLAYSAKLPFPGSLYSEPTRFAKLSRQAGVEFREKRVDQSLALFETAFEELGFSLCLSKHKLILSLLLVSGYLSSLRLVRYTYLRLFASSQRESHLNPSLLHEVILSLQLVQRVQTERGCRLNSLSASLTAHALSQRYRSLLPKYLVQYSHQSLVRLLRRNTVPLLDRLIVWMVRLSVGRTETVTSELASSQELYLWCNTPQETGEWDFDKEIQTKVFCTELSLLLKSAISLSPNQEHSSRHTQRFSAHVQSLLSSDEITHWWATVGVMASECKQGISSDQHSYNTFFKNIPSSLIASSMVIPKALVLSSKFRLSVQVSPLHRPALLVRLSQEATELTWSSFQCDRPEEGSRELFLLLQTLCCKWLLEGLTQLWSKSGCVSVQYQVFQSYLSGLFILERLADALPCLSELLSHHKSLSYSLSHANPCHTGRQLEAVSQEALTGATAVQDYATVLI